ncbi:MAG: hypothetical protein ACKVVP_02435 [Chloroflexota bacterium]
MRAATTRLPSEKTHCAAPPALPVWAWRARHRVWLIAREHPRLFYTLARDRGFAANQLIGPDTELVIEGYPRSANSYAVISFQLAQPQARIIAHHTHAPAQVIQAAKRGLPLLVPIRHPGDAVASLVIRDHRYTVDLALEAYVRFYETVLPYRDRMILARFEDITRDFGSVIQQLNHRFGTAFTLPESEPEARDRCFRMIEQIDQQSGGSERSVARPSAWRQERKRERVAEIQCAAHYADAIRIYERATESRISPARRYARVIVLST